MSASRNDNGRITITDADPVPYGSRTFFEVLIPLRNCERWIGECLDSVLAQKFPSWHATVIDDASTDGSWDIIQAKVGSDPRFRCVRNTKRVTALPNLMQYTREAIGDHVAILDGDDAFLDVDTLDIIFAVYHDAPDVIATSGQYVRWPDGGIGHCSATTPPGVDWFDTWIFGHTLTYRRDICIEMMDKYPHAYLDIDTGRPFEITYDLALWFPIVAWAEWNQKRIAHIDIPNYLYRIWCGNDHATREGLEAQRYAQRKIALIWMNELIKHDRQEGLRQAQERA